MQQGQERDKTGTRQGYDMGGVESEISVCPRPLLQFLQFFQFLSVRLRQVMSVYIGGTGRGA